MVQSCPEASPMKWHQAHTTWFFETFVLRPFLPEKRLRASFSRPSLAEIIAFRSHVDRAMEKLIASEIHDEAARRFRLGLNHEQQHQGLMLAEKATAMNFQWTENAAKSLGWIGLAALNEGFKDTTRSASENIASVTQTAGAKLQNVGSHRLARLLMPLRLMNELAVEIGASG
jgi:hypothetical protein